MYPPICKHPLSCAHNRHNSFSPSASSAPCPRRLHLSSRAPVLLRSQRVTSSCPSSSAYITLRHRCTHPGTSPCTSRSLSMTTHWHVEHDIINTRPKASRASLSSADNYRSAESGNVKRKKVPKVQQTSHPPHTLWPTNRSKN
jgi:hypothetical protein